MAWRQGLDAGNVVVVLQGVPKPFADLPNVPLAINLAKTDEARQLIELGIHTPSIFARPLVLPPGTPKERVEILRKAFQETLKDNEFLAETGKAKLEMNTSSGDETEKNVARIFTLEPALLAKLNDLLYK